jgi:N-acyl-D-aspartate/D-glutamate deacylase
MAHDVVIRNGTVIDGTGRSAVRADVAIDADRVTVVGDVDASGANQVIDAEGKLVTPGFVDLHSHLDAQVGWDPTMSSSCYHGVTSVVMGNCGMTFAPVRPGAASVLAEAMETVEDIPASAIIDGLPWNWEGYGGYLDAVEQMPLGLNTGGYVGDVAIRLYVAGEASCEEDFEATPDQLAEMASLVDDALRAGALGYSISRSLFHRVPDGRNVPGTWSKPEEFFAIAEPLGRLGKGVLESAPRYNFADSAESRVDEELGWMAELSRRTGRPFSFNLQQIESLGTHYRDVIRLSEKANRTGAQLHPQITPRGVGVLFSLAANTLIDHLPAFQSLKTQDLTGRLTGLRDADLRARLIEESAGDAIDPFWRMYLMPAGRPASYDYTSDDSIAGIAQAAGVSPIEAYIDAMIDSDGASLVNWPVMNQSSEAIEEQVLSPVTIMGLADAGAHATQIMDASQPTYFLAHWARDEQIIGIEDAVKAVSSDTARFIGYVDRGTLTEGAFADVNVIDLEALSLPLPEIVHDFPGGAPRFVQRAEGIDHTFVNGQHFMEAGEHTGATAGRLLRG